jgi:hypothetical protein
MTFRDGWPSAAEPIRRLNKAVSSDACTLGILPIDDGSAHGLAPVQQNLNFDSGIAGSSKFRELLTGCSNILPAKRSLQFGGLGPFHMAAEAAASQSDSRAFRTGLPCANLAFPAGKV